MKIGIILATIILLRLIALFATGWYQNPILWEYEEVANSILNGNGFICTHLGTSYRALSPPIYPLLCAGIYSLTRHSHLAVLYLQGFCSLLLSIFVYLIALRFGDRRAAYLAILFAGLHPVLFFYDIRNLHPLGLDSMFIALVIWLFLRLRERLSLRNGLLLGLSFGIAILERASLTLFLPVGLVWLFRKEGATRRMKVKCAVMLMIGTLLLVGIWAGRNMLVFKRFIYTLSTQGELLWRGNNPNASGSSYSPEGKTIFELAPQGFKKEIYKLDELGQRALFWNEAWQFIKADWVRFTKLYLEKLRIFWYFSGQSGITYPSVYLTPYKFYYTVILSFAILGLAVLIKRRKYNVEISLLVSLFLVMSLAQSLFYVEGRHRVSIEPLLLIFTAWGISLLSDKIKALLKWTF